MVTGSLFRLQHLVSDPEIYTLYGFKGLIAQGQFTAAGTELYQIQNLYPKVELDIYQLEPIAPLQERRIAIRGQRRYRSNESWVVAIDVWNV